MRRLEVVVHPIAQRASEVGQSRQSDTSLAIGKVITIRDSSRAFQGKRLHVLNHLARQASSQRIVLQNSTSSLVSSMMAGEDTVKKGLGPLCLMQMSAIGGAG